MSNWEMILRDHTETAKNFNGDAEVVSSATARHACFVAAAKVAALEAQVEAVREVRDRYSGWHAHLAVGIILEALDAALAGTAEVGITDRDMADFYHRVADELDESEMEQRAKVLKLEQKVAAQAAQIEAVRKLIYAPFIVCQMPQVCRAPGNRCLVCRLRDTLAGTAEEAP